MNLEKLTNSENSEILNGLSSVVNFTKTKTAKALAAGSIFLTASALSTGIIPVQRNIAGINITNVNSADARATFPGFGSCGSYPGYQPGCVYVLSYLPWNTLWRSQSHRNWLCYRRFKYNSKVRGVYSTRVKGWPACVTKTNPNADYAHSNQFIANIK